LDFEAGPFTVLFGKNNTGKTNILETIFGVLAPDAMPGYYTRGTPARGVRGWGEEGPPGGAIYVELELGLPFDDEVLSKGPGGAGTVTGEFLAVDVPRLPPLQVAFTGEKSVLLFGDPRDYFAQGGPWDGDKYDGELEHQFESLGVEGPRLRPLFLDWEFVDINERVGAAILRPLMNANPVLSPKDGWLELVGKLAEDAGGDHVWRVRPEIYERVERFADLATDLLPDFIDGSVRAEFHIPNAWGKSPWVSVEYEERGTGQRADSIADIGRGAARWIAVSTQIAQQLIAQGHDILPGSAQKPFSGNILFVDEPEAHLHPSAVASIVRWCQRMVALGFNVVVASHHEEFLRAAGDDLTLVHVTRDPTSGLTHARTLPSSRTTRLLEVAADVGMHPASALSIQRAILFVEGPLDESVLDEYAGLDLDGAGVKVIPIHGTKNLEGLVAVELVTDLGIKMGILTDATDPTTMAEKSGKKRSSEERRVMRVVQMAKDKGLPPPTPFGVPEDDLLFALPADAIRDYLKGPPFPGWKELVAECRQALGKGPSDSVDWKLFAHERYGLQITTPGGVRNLVRALDLNGVALPSIRRVIDEIVEWAKSTE
jgi:energy-coupling factor transporter ATP-binding protein EcfA2